MALKGFSVSRAKRHIAQAALIENIGTCSIINPLKNNHNNVSYLGGRRFKFLNKESDIDDYWCAPQQSPLWQFNVHYFDYLFSEKGRIVGIDLILNWIREVTPGQSVGWHPYTTSRRIPNWIWFISSNSTTLDEKSMREIAISLLAQTRFLAQSLEKDLLGNHLIANAHALVVAGLFFLDNELETLGLQILNEQLKEQILTDGGHYERSPMYHQIVLEDLSSICAAFIQNGRAIPDFLAISTKKMALFLSRLCADEGLPLIGDTAHEITGPLHELLNYLVNLGLLAPQPLEKKSFYAEEFGIVNLKKYNLWLQFDVGKLGPDFLLGHAHNDTLSIQLKIGEEEILSDSGIYQYQGRFRNYFRSARAHNVAMVSRVEPNEIWSAFRVGRRGYPHSIAVDLTNAQAQASHDCYRHLGLAITRHVRLLEEGLVWIDIVSSINQINRKFQANLHFGPGVKYLALEQSNRLTTIFLETQKSKRLWLVTDTIETPQILTSSHSEQFGKRKRRLLVRTHFQGSESQILCHGIFQTPPPSDIAETWRNLAGCLLG